MFTMEEVTVSDSLYMQLHKLSAAANSEEEVEHILTTLWRTRRTGLSYRDKSRFQSLLNLASLPKLDPVLASLRSLIRKCVQENFSGDDLLKLFPPDLSSDLQNTLISVLKKYQNQWKQELSTQQVRTNLPPSFPSSEISTGELWPRQDDRNGRFGYCTSIIPDTTASHFAPVSVQHDVVPPHNLANVPRLKSITWTTESHNSEPANKIAIITLKLQDYTKTPSGEMEVKFQLSRDTLEAMLRSLTYINEQLSGMVGTSCGPAQKKQKQ